MSAGSGITHSEYNLEDAPTQIFQIWILPQSGGDAPRWGARPFPKGERAGRFVTLASGAAEAGDALPIRADARVLGATIRAGESVDYALAEGRRAYLVAATGAILVNGAQAQARDGVAIADERRLRVEALEDSEVVLVDVR